MARVLIVEGNKATPRQIIRQIAYEGHEIRLIPKPDAAINWIKDETRVIALAIIDLSISDVSDVVRAAVNAGIPHIIVHGAFMGFQIPSGVKYIRQLDMGGVNVDVIIPLLADADNDPEAVKAVARISGFPSVPPGRGTGSN
jgi:hypothetical protein